MFWPLFGISPVLCFVFVSPATVIDCCVNFRVFVAVLNGHGNRLVPPIEGVWDYWMLHGGAWSQEPGDLATLHGR